MIIVYAEQLLQQMEVNHPQLYVLWTKKLGMIDERRIELLWSSIAGVRDGFKKSDQPEKLIRRVLYVLGSLTMKMPLTKKKKRRQTVLNLHQNLIGYIDGLCDLVVTIAVGEFERTAAPTKNREGPIQIEHVQQIDSKTLLSMTESELTSTITKWKVVEIEMIARRIDKDASRTIRE
jgi:hypothetical protein